MTSSTSCAIPQLEKLIFNYSTFTQDLAIFGLKVALQPLQWLCRQCRPHMICTWHQTRFLGRKPSFCLPADVRVLGVVYHLSLMNYFPFEEKALQVSIVLNKQKNVITIMKIIRYVLRYRITKLLMSKQLLPASWYCVVMSIVWSDVKMSDILIKSDLLSYFKDLTFEQNAEHLSFEHLLLL